MWRKSAYRVWLLAALLTLGASPEKPDAESNDGLQLYFRHADPLAITDQGLAKYPDTAPGESKRLPRDFPDAPPQINHEVEDLLPITLDDNQCLDCHDPENAIEETDVPIPKSHFRIPVMGEGGPGDPMVWVVKGYKETKSLNGARYNCVMCHTPQATNATQPSNRFAPARKN